MVLLRLGCGDKKNVSLFFRWGVVRLGPEPNKRSATVCPYPDMAECQRGLYTYMSYRDRVCVCVCVCVRRLILRLARTRGNAKRIYGGKCGAMANFAVNKLLTAATVVFKCQYECTCGRW